MKLKTNEKKKRETSWCGTYSNSQVKTGNFAMVLKHRQPVCPHWMNGNYYKKDSDCPYAHPADCQGCILGAAQVAKGDTKGGKKGKGDGKGGKSGKTGKGSKDSSGKGGGKGAGKKGKTGKGSGKGKTNYEQPSQSWTGGTDKSQIPCKSHAWSNHCERKNNGCPFNHSFPGGQGMPQWAPQYCKDDEKRKFPDGFNKQGPSDAKGKSPGKGGGKGKTGKGGGKGKKGKSSKGPALAASGEPEAESSPIKDQQGDQSKPSRRQKRAEKAAEAKAKAKP